MVTNIDLPAEYEDLMNSYGAKVIKVKFDHFNFGSQYKWSLAFYKLCALWHMAHETDYDNYMYLDSDVYVQLPLDNVWDECRTSILLYDICEPVKDPFLHEAAAFTDTDYMLWVHYGGEFFAASHANTIRFVDRCQEIYDDLVRKDITVNNGDEFVTSVAAQTCGLRIHNAGRYICRYWTGFFRLVSTNYRYNPVCVLHVPVEKEHGMIRIYNSYVRFGRLPKKSQVWRLLHLVSIPYMPIKGFMYWAKSTIMLK